MSIRSRWWGPRLGGCNPDGLDSTSGSHTIAVMAKKPIQKKPDPMFIWEISRLTGTPARVLGTVEAPDDQEKAIRAGIERFGITNPAQQERLSAEGEAGDVTAPVRAQIISWPARHV